MMNVILMGLIKRANTTAADVLPTINVDRWDNVTNALGINQSNTTTIDPNYGTALWNMMGAYVDAIGPLAWVILFAIPFIMMWITHSDMVPAGILGIILGIYVAGFIGGAYLWLGVVFMVISGVTVLWSLYQKRG